MLSVSKYDGDGTWRYVCGRPSGCGTPEAGPFTSSGWPSKAVALARGEQHEAEHEGGTPMPSLDVFRAEHKVRV